MTEAGLLREQISLLQTNNCTSATQNQIMRGYIMYIIIPMHRYIKIFSLINPILSTLKCLQD